MENDDFNNNKLQDGQLPRILLPEGVSEEDIAKIINNVMVERLVAESNPWSQWILLGALEILANRGAPFLDKKSLDELQGSATGLDIGHNSSTNEASHCMNKSGNYLMDSAQLSSKEALTSSIEEVVNKVEKKDFGVMVTPKSMKLTASKWIQVHICKTKKAGTQTSIEMSDTSSQTINDCLPESDVNNKTYRSLGTQTLIVNLRNAETQCDAESTESNCWKLIPVSDVSNKKISKHKIDEGTTRIEKDQESSSSPNTSPVENVHLFPGKKKGSIRMFHGRPLIGKGSIKEAANIPSSPVCGSLLSDPRSEIEVK